MLGKMFAEITDTLPDPYLLLTRDGTVVCANQAARKKLSKVATASALPNLSEIVMDDSSVLDALLLMWSRSSSPMPGKLTMSLNDGTALHCLCRGKALKSVDEGDKRLIMLQCSDKRASTSSFVTLNEKIEQLKREVAERRNAEAAISQLNEELEKRVEERTAELKKSMDELQKAQGHLVRSERMAALGGMVAGVAHEINTPVGVGITAASFLADQVDHYNGRYREGVITRADFESFLGTATESSAIILSNLRRAAELVRSFKQVAVDQTSDDKRRFNLKENINELLTSLHPALRKTSHRVTCHCPGDIELESHPGAISQILNNLIGNSLLHGFENMEEGTIDITVTREHNHLLLRYRDNGAGIPAKNLARVFDPFFTTKRNRGGSGLGMNIVYNLVTDKLGGEVSLTSNEGEGMECHITLPLDPAAASQPLSR